jgi:glycosyltransferase involved in cell wall biosynthesis
LEVVRVAETLPTLTVVILTLNEERHIAECVASVRGADEVIVVDSGSSDRTQELAQAAGARVVVHALTDFAAQHNYANELATSDWVLHLDADERATPELLREISAASRDGNVDAYRVPELTYIFGAALRHGGWYPQYHIRLQRRGRSRWEGRVHESVEVQGPVGVLREPIIHHAHPSITAFIVKLNRYTTMEAAGTEASTFSLATRAVLEPGPYFAYKYLVQGGFRDGWRGLAIAMLLSFYRCVSLLKAVEHQHQSATGHPPDRAPD